MVTASFGRAAGVRGGGSGLLRVVVGVSLVLFIETGVARFFFFWRLDVRCRRYRRWFSVGTLVPQQKVLLIIIARSHLATPFSHRG